MGIITAVLGLLMVLWALPAQAVKNYREKRCGVVLPLVMLPIMVYIVRSIYAVQRQAWGIVVPDIVGIICSLVILTQWFIYRKNKKT